MLHFARSAATVVMACLALAGSPASAEPDDGIVMTGNGPVRGIEMPDMNVFLGIPYAAPPVGNLRWRPPQPHARWHGPLDATRFGSPCPQRPDSFSNAGRGSVTEDCLFLNVYTRVRDDDERAEPKPVMVFVHGGGLSAGESDLYDATWLVKEGGVVVVTINYRIGLLGFLAHPALSRETSSYASGNYGLMDQQFALQWVQRNIAHFGGNPDNVTIFGESAGGLSVHANLASPTAAGLFHKAIAESGAYSLAQPTLLEAEAAGSAFASLPAVGCGTQTAACLRALPIATILANQSNCCSLTVDGQVLPESVVAAFATGRFNRVPVIEGSNHDEWRLFVAQAEFATGTPLAGPGYIPAIAATLGVPAPTAYFIGTFIYPLAAYPPPGTAPSIALGAVGTDAIFACNTRVSARLLAQYVPTYQYEFSDRSAPIPALARPSFPGGAYHSSELQYLFDFRALGYPALNAGQEGLSDAMLRYWTRFAATGNPNRHGAPAWPRYGTSDQFQSLELPAPVTKGGFAADHKCAFWGSP